MASMNPCQEDGLTVIIMCFFYEGGPLSQASQSRLNMTIKTLFVPSQMFRGIVKVDRNIQNADTLPPFNLLNVDTVSHLQPDT